MKYYDPVSESLHIGVNKAYSNNKIKFDWLFAQDYLAVKPYIDEILDYPAEIFLGGYMDITMKKISLIPMKYLSADNVNLYVVDRPRNLCFPYIEQCGLMSLLSVVFSAMQVALYSNPKKIYLVGCDCSDSGYFDGSMQIHHVSNLIPSWEKFKAYQEAFYPDVEVISINPVGLKGMFHDVYTQSYLNEHPEINANDVEILKDAD